MKSLRIALLIGLVVATSLMLKSAFFAKHPTEPATSEEPAIGESEAPKAPDAQSRQDQGPRAFSRSALPADGRSPAPQVSPRRPGNTRSVPLPGAQTQTIRPDGERLPSAPQVSGRPSGRISGVQAKRLSPDEARAELQGRMSPEDLENFMRQYPNGVPKISVNNQDGIKSVPYDSLRPLDCAIDKVAEYPVALEIDASGAVRQAEYLMAPEGITVPSIARECRFRPVLDENSKAIAVKTVFRPAAH